MLRNVIPAKAGTQSRQETSLGGFIYPCWAPACAGVTESEYV
jgi:hypothetical protein